MGVSRPYKHGGHSYYATVRREGRSWQVPLRTRDETRAVRLAAVLAEEVESGRWQPPGSSLALKGLVADYRRAYEAAAGPGLRASRERSWKADHSQLENVVAWLQRERRRRAVAEVTREDALRYKDWRTVQTVGKGEAKRTTSIETVKKAIRLARAAWSWALPSAPNPWSRIKFPKPARKNPRNLSDFELRKVFPDAGANEGPLVVAAMALALYAGLRLAEVLDLPQRYLRWGETGARIYLEDPERLKGRTPRSTVFPGELQAILKPFKASTGPVVHGITRSQVQKAVARVATRTGVDFSLHDLRRTFAGLIVRRGGQPAQAQKYLGHASIATTEGYYLERDAEPEEADASRFDLGLAGEIPGESARQTPGAS